CNAFSTGTCAPTLVNIIPSGLVCVRMLNVCGILGFVKAGCVDGRGIGSGVCVGSSGKFWLIWLVE
ncbi:hypothetical protein, partial [Staphylococcus capitis]|uniref:hypothetical protein n=1 Tax=Staphylococcus capitis TaxID=29388 RepID=UPI001C930B54